MTRASCDEATRNGSTLRAASLRVLSVLDESWRVLTDPAPCDIPWRPWALTLCYALASAWSLSLSLNSTLSLPG